jgi:manganese transport protein
VPAFAVAAAGVNVTNALVLSQVVLSIILPIPMIALLVLSSKRSLMGAFTARRLTIAGASCAVALILGLNVVLLVQTLGLH